MSHMPQQQEFFFGGDFKLENSRVSKVFGIVML